MYLKVTSDKLLYQQVKELFLAVAEANQAIKNWVNAQGASHCAFYRRGLVNRPAGLYFQKNPEPESGWRYHKRNQWWVPARTKAGLKIVEEMSRLPVMSYKPLTELLEYKSTTGTEGGNLIMVHCPDVGFYGKVLLIKYPDFLHGQLQKQPKGDAWAQMDEITASEYADLENAVDELYLTPLKKTKELDN